MAVAAPPRTITLKLEDYLETLIEHNVTDPARWPEGMQQGAALLRRIREIEAACVAEHGAFDFDKLAPLVQDEYDHAIIDLDEIVEPQDFMPADEFFASLKSGDAPR